MQLAWSRVACKADWLADKNTDINFEGDCCMSTSIMPTYYNQLQVTFEHGQGAWLWDTSNQKYLDALSGIAVCSLGHAHPDITRTISEQAAKLLHTSNTYIIGKQVELAKKLTAIAGFDQAYFCNSGAEANETAIKLARLYARKKAIAEPIIITLKNSFHGRSLATVSASGSERLQQGFEPLVKTFLHVNLNDIDELKRLTMQHQDQMIAIMLEPLQGDGGIHVADEKYLQTIRNLCDQHDWLMILDEVQTGMGRTGKWFCYQHSGVAPDIMTVAKALGNGVPIAACLARGKAINLFGPGKHGSTFGGNPLVCAVGCAVIDVMQRDNIPLHAEKMGNYLQNKLRELMSEIPGIKAVRGKGLMLGVELDKNCLEMPGLALKHKLLINVVSNKVIRILPPLIITEAEADEIVVRLHAAIKDFYGLK